MGWSPRVCLEIDEVPALPSLPKHGAGVAVDVIGLVRLLARLGVDEMRLRSNSTGLVVTKMPYMQGSSNADQVAGRNF